MNSNSSAQLLHQIAQIQRMERGKLTVMRQTPDGPYYKLQAWEDGKNLSRYIARDQAETVREALEGYRQFQELTGQYAQTVIDQTRAELTAHSKKKDLSPPPEILLAQDQEIQQVITQFQAGAPTAAAVAQLEGLVRTAVYKSANDVVGWLLQQAAQRVDDAYQPKPGEEFKGRETMQAQGMFGYFDLTRDYYYDAGKNQGHHPADDALGLEVSYTPALSKLLCLEGADEATYLKAERHLEQTGGICVSARQIQRVVQRIGQDAQAWQKREVVPAECETCPVPVFYVSADGTGIPMRPDELEGRPGKQPDGKAKTRQVYLGCIFTQHRLDDEGHPVRDWESTTYVSSLDSIDQFGPMLRREALRRGMGTALKVVLLIDGAEGLAHMGTLCFKDAVQIVDFFHALEHAGEVLVALLGSKDHPEYESRLHRWADRLLEDEVEALITETRHEASESDRSEPVEKELGYFVRNVSRMRYGTFRKQGFFIGSGVIEAGCKTVIGTRCKQSGMFWGELGAENILAFRCIHASRRLDNFWNYRLNQRTALNDSLPLAA